MSHIRTTEREAAYLAIDSERRYQDVGAGNAERTGEFKAKKLTPGEVIICMEKCLSDAREAWYKPEGPVLAAPFVRKVAALGVQYMENYGAPEREGF